ncbi:TPA: DUF645 family protein, partial [Vibrio cholerae]|nr:DUF645 family protein [Vibrio cholerae]
MIAVIWLSLSRTLNVL